jgi:hypothetical protein
VPSEPAGPRLAHRRREHELFPQVEKLVGVDVVADVVVGAFAKHLFVDTSTVGPVAQVAGEGWAASANVEGKLNPAVRLRDGGIVQIGRNGHRPRQGTEIGGAAIGLSVRLPRRPTWSDTEDALHEGGFAFALGAFPVAVDVGRDLEAGVAEVAAEPGDLPP